MATFRTCHWTCQGGYHCCGTCQVVVDVSGHVEVVMVLVIVGCWMGGHRCQMCQGSGGGWWMH